MTLTHERLELHIADLKAQRDKIIGNANALTGAIQFAEALLKELDIPEPEVPTLDLVSN